MFLRSDFGHLRGRDVATVAEKSFPGINSFLLDQCPPDTADASNEFFPAESLFEMVSEAVALDFNHCCGLLDLDVEIQRQATERKRLFESFADPHPDIVFGQRKDSWFSQLVYQRTACNNYHVTFVSSVRFIEVRHHYSSQLLK